MSQIEFYSIRKISQYSEMFNGDSVHHKFRYFVTPEVTRQAIAQFPGQPYGDSGSTYVLICQWNSV
jgi:hypothetical protein